MQQDKHFVEQLWLIALGLVIIAYEVVLGAITAFDLAAIGASFIVGGLSMFFGFPLDYAITISAVCIVFYFTLLRSHVRPWLLTKAQQAGVGSLIGKKGIVIQSPTRNKKGKVLVECTLWPAISDRTLAPQEMVEVVGFEKGNVHIAPIRS